MVVVGHVPYTMSEMMQSTTEVQTGDELEIDYTDARNADDSGTKTVTAQRISDDKLYLHTEDGEEFGYIRFTSAEVEEVAQMRTTGGTLLARIHSVKIAEEGR